MKISNILIALTIVFAVACSGKKSENDHGHEHGTEAHDHAPDANAEDHGHEHDAHPEQEEFTIQGDSIQVTTDTTHHTHEDGSTHHDH
jgi:hypothetical protein